MGQYTDEQLEADHRLAGHDAPRVTADHIDGLIKDVRYHHFEGTTMTVCLVTLENGFHTTGFSASASEENFDAEIGRKLAFDHARSRIWELEGYLLRQRLHEHTAHDARGHFVTEHGGHAHQAHEDAGR